jgi:plastocyanin
MRKVALTVLIPLTGLSAIAYAADTTIRQKGRVFSAESITVKKGDTVTFLNDDNLPHNIASTSAGNQFNLGSQAPGAQTPVTFKQAGEVKVICAIHPRMKMTVTVTD